MKIARVTPFPLTLKMDEPQGTSQAMWTEISILMVKVETEDGLVGWGEGLGRRAPGAYARIVEELLAPAIIGEELSSIEAIWHRLYRLLSGKSGGMLLEAIAAVDIALWDAWGRALNQPIHRLLGSTGHEQLDTYASSIGWDHEDVALRQTSQVLDWGFRQIKVKLGAPVDKALARARLIRQTVGPDIRLMADTNWAFDIDDALKLARGLAELNYDFLEEPIVPEDIEGYRILASKSPIRLAAGESEHTAMGVASLISSRSVGLVQPNVTRSGGISETRKITTLARAFHVKYAPHVGFSGAVCAAASLHLAAAANNFDTFECMIFPNPFRDDVVREPPGDRRTLQGGQVLVPQGPGLGVEVNETVVRRLSQH
ncbi:MAG TPA: mandelate racemase/muconate lactonizing enzyme family protein [Devosiaceae bacterium]|jgi:L-alanine-DL-glutamate epimerase-like enolase superfamily enzyme